MRALSIAGTGMSAQQLNVEVIANNIANINTTGYKRTRAEFTDLLYQMERVQGIPNQTGEGVIPEGAQLGLGTRLAAIRLLTYRVRWLKPGMSRTLLKMPRLALLFERYAASARRSTVGVVV